MVDVTDVFMFPGMKSIDSFASNRSPLLALEVPAAKDARVAFVLLV